MTDALQRGYAAWQAGKPINPQAGGQWIEGWRTGHDGTHFSNLAAKLGAQLHGWSYRNSASFVFPNGELHSLDGQMLRAVERLASGMEAAAAGETTKIGSTEGDSPASQSEETPNA